MDTLRKIYHTISLSDVPIILQFLTTWCLLLLLVHSYVYMYIDILLVSTIVFVAGYYISHVHPRRFTLKYTKDTIVVDGWFKTLTADVLHMFVFVWALFWYGRYYVHNPHILQTSIGAVSLLTIYYITNNPSKLYGVSEREVVMLFATTVVCYMLILTYMR